MMVRGSIALILTSGILFSGCSAQPLNGQILLPVRFCVVKGADLTALQNGSFSDVGNDKIDAMVDQAIKGLNANIWIPGANISFYTALYENPQGGAAFNVPVIADPQPPPIGPGLLGDIEVGEVGIQFETPEMKDAHNAALRAWSLGNNGNKTGIIVILARACVTEAGLPSGSLAVTSPHFDTLQRNNGADLCVVPRHLLVGDVADQYVVIATTSPFASSSAPFYHTLAHEFGHALLLSHGDGQPNGGTLPPVNGPRKFDEDCGGTKSGLSLMTSDANSNVITVLQRELARDAAILVPGHSGPIQ